jgi:hypothetical protein
MPPPLVFRFAKSGDGSTRRDSSVWVCVAPRDAFRLLCQLPLQTVTYLPQTMDNHIKETPKMQTTT